MSREVWAIFVLPALLGAAVPGPVSVSDCRGGVTSVELVELADYKVTFRNTAPVAIDQIRFAIPYGRRKTAVFDLRERLEPNAEVTRHLKKTLSSGLYAYASTHNDCNIDFVHFTTARPGRRRPPTRKHPHRHLERRASRGLRADDRV